MPTDQGYRDVPAERARETRHSLYAARTGVRITGLCRKMFRVPISTLSFIDGHRQWFKASEGMGTRETDRKPALCYQAIQQNNPLVVPNTLQDPRFSENPFVLGKPLRFYAGAQLKIAGAIVGTLCIMDTQPRGFDRESFGMLLDLAAIAVDELQLRNLSMRDSLTGALSRRAFRAEGERLASLASRHGHALTCAVMDIDHFKSINDRFGHAVGDTVLAGTVDVCRRTLRGSDTIGRIGGEEFGIHQPRRWNGGAGKGPRLAIAANQIVTPCGVIQVTCSLGGAQLLPGQQFDDTLHCADLAMYSAKNAGRNQAIAWVDPAPSISPAKRRVFKAGQIVFNSGRSTFECTVRSLSHDSATVEVTSDADVPEKFKLSIAADELSRACQVVSRSETRIEVAFFSKKQRDTDGVIGLSAALVGIDVGRYADRLAGQFRGRALVVGDGDGRPDLPIEVSSSASRRTAGSAGRSAISFCNSKAALAASQSSMP